jgi:hypothetical protein
MVTDAYILKRIEMLQEELESLKRAVLKDSSKKPGLLRGIWKGVDFTDEEIDEVKSLWTKKL